MEAVLSSKENLQQAANKRSGMIRGCVDPSTPKQQQSKRPFTPSPKRRVGVVDTCSLEQGNGSGSSLEMELRGQVRALRSCVEAFLERKEDVANRLLSHQRHLEELLERHASTHKGAVSYEADSTDVKPCQFEEPAEICAFPGRRAFPGRSALLQNGKDPTSESRSTCHEDPAILTLAPKSLNSSSPQAIKGVSMDLVKVNHDFDIEEQTDAQEIRPLNSITTSSTASSQSEGSIILEGANSSLTLSSQNQEPKKRTSGRKGIRLRSREGSRANAIATSGSFEFSFALLIISNAIVMCVEAQYVGLDVGYQLGYPTTTQPAPNSWPHADIIFKILDVLFGICFTLEVTVKLIGLRRSFFKMGWNLFDAFLVLAWVLDAMFAGLFPVSPFTLKLFRLARLLRLLRLARTFQVFDTLHLMGASLSASVPVLMWSVLLLIGIMLASALFMNSIVGFYIADKGQPIDKQMEAFLYFGTFSRSMLSVFEITFGNWVPLTRFLHENISECFGAVIMLYYCLVSFAVVMVIRGVFLHETFQAAANDDDLMISRQKRLKNKTISKVEAFFHELDVSGHGYLTLEQFMQVMSEDRVKLWLGAMGLEIDDAELIFKMVDDGDHQLTPEEFVEGFTALKGHARGVDMVQVLRLVRNMEARVEAISELVGVDDVARKSRPSPNVDSKLAVEGDNVQKEGMSHLSEVGA